jgi:hypothetical protein
MKWKRADIIDAIIKMRIEKGVSTKTILNDFLMGELKFKQSYSYVLLQEARENIKKIYQTTNEALANEALGHLESLYEDAIKDKNKKLALEIRKEINKLVGAYAAEKVEVSGNVNIETIKLIEVIKDNGDENKQ